ncbi:MAG TPA: hypothetical protein VFV68_12595, partial [Agriterribacter sp.]|nr:hypothetical protein [Agriterribacter sp.]
MLKRVAAIPLAALLFFNWYGYQLVTDYLQYQSDRQLEARLDNNDYHESELVELRIPLTILSYNDYIDWKNYERCDGEIEFGGIHYKYVKRKIERGELVLLCLPDHSKQRILAAREAFFKLVNDLEQDKPDKKSNSHKSTSQKIFHSDYRSERNNWIIAAMQPETVKP